VFIVLCNCCREGNDPDDYSRLTYRKLLEEVCRFANVLKSKGVSKGDRVAIYMPMILEVVIAILACSRIGAVHTIVVCHHSHIDCHACSLRVSYLLYTVNCQKNWWYVICTGYG
jgi:Acyl-coenzyme A synthetases/AMP-(fatty) acid ligases